MAVQSNQSLEVAAVPTLGRRRTALWVAIGVAVLSGMLWAVYPLPDAAARLNVMPRTGSEFASEDIALTPTELQVLGRVNVVHRRYQLGDAQFYATVIDGTKDRHAVHDPRYCFQGAGWKVLSERKLPLNGGEGHLVHAVNGQYEVQALFWFSDGAGRYTSLLRYWWQTTLRRMSLGRSGAEPVLVVLQSFGHQQPEWSALAPTVIEALNL